LLRVELQRREPGLAPALHRRAYAWCRDHEMAGEAIGHAIEAGAYAEAAELIEASWVSYASAGKHGTVLAWIRRFPDEILGGDVRLLLVAAWVLSLSGRREEAARAIAAVEELGEPGGGPFPDGFSSVEASLTMLRAVFPWVTSAPIGMGLYWRAESREADAWFAEAAARSHPRAGSGPRRRRRAGCLPRSPGSRPRRW
jgi:ATP/maltotriose-dependent transcriptional regulator MalT